VAFAISWIAQSWLGLDALFGAPLGWYFAPKATYLKGDGPAENLHFGLTMIRVPIIFFAIAAIPAVLLFLTPEPIGFVAAVASPAIAAAGTYIARYLSGVYPAQLPS
jgi:hypothetical protein